MSTQASRSAARFMLAPAVGALLLWMVVPLALTLWFSFQRYNLQYPDRAGFVGLCNYAGFVESPAFWAAIANTLLLLAIAVRADSEVTLSPGDVVLLLPRPDKIHRFAENGARQ